MSGHQVRYTRRDVFTDPRLIHARCSTRTGSQAVLATRPRCNTRPLIPMRLWLQQQDLSMTEGALLQARRHLLAALARERHSSM